jgi:L,D-transpeptidase YcbB
VRKHFARFQGATVGLLVISAVVTWPITGCRTSPSKNVELAQALADRSLAPQGRASRDVWTALQAFYAARQTSPAWTTSQQRDNALKVLASASDQGLDAKIYDFDALCTESDALARIRVHDAGVRRREARLDVRLTASLLFLGKDVAVGPAELQRFDPRQGAGRPLPDLAGTLADAVAKGDLEQWLGRVEPPHKGYRGLVHALAMLRAAERKGGWSRVGARPLRRGLRGPAVAAVAQRLVASGDLSGNRDSRRPEFDATLERAVQSFQNHHGLQPTGRVDPATIAAMNVPLADRIRQVRVNLQRWRSMPDDLGRRHFVVNIPQFHLYAVESDRVVLDIRAIVGKPGDDTPSFSSRMTTVVFSPYWNIPERIAEDETLPALSSDPGYLARNNIEVVRVNGREAELVDPDSLDWSDPESLRGLSFRQRPGAANSLGLVKFMFPNRYNVYVHDTPAEHLFARVARTFSHGCIRIEDPMALAQYVLRDQPRWTREAIAEAMSAGEERAIKLTAPIPIHLTYFTAWTDDQGGLHFRGDVYGHDGE